MEFCIWDKCNNRCVMCSNPEYPWQTESGHKVEYDFETLVARLNIIKNTIKKDEPINITGGETTLHPKFFDILKYLQDNFPATKINLLTNGRMFAYEEFAKKTLSFSNVNIVLPFHGYNDKTHDSVTLVKGSFKQVVSGLNNLRKYKNINQEIEARIIITRATHRFIDKITKYILKNFSLINRIVLVFMEIEGHALKNIKNVALRYEDFYPYFGELEKYLKNASGKEIRLYHFPLCTAPVNFWPYIWRTLPDYEVSYIDACKKCKFKKYCLGIHKGYLENIGEDEFRPINKKIKIIEGENFQFYPIKKVIK